MHLPVPSTLPTPQRSALSRIVLLALGLWAISCSRSPAAPEVLEPVFPGVVWERVDPKAAGYDTGTLDALSAYLESLDTTAMMVVVDGRVIFEYGYIQRLSYLASVRKSVLAMLYGRYVADGTIDLSLTLADLGMNDIGGLLPIELQATVEDLISARSGVYHAASNPGDNSADAPPRGSQQPGAYFLYNNWDFNAAGAVFEQMTGKNIYDALGSDLAVPIGMQDFDRDAQHKSGDLQRSRYPAYHMWLSVRDMARLGYLMLRDGEWDGVEVVPEEWALQVHSVITPLEEMNPEWRRDRSFGYGYMWWVWDGPDTGDAYAGAYTGIGAYGQYITVLPELDLVIAHKTDPDDGSVSRSDFLAAVQIVVQAHDRGGG